MISQLSFVTIGLTLTGLLAAGPSQARPRLLPEGSHPPVFTLPDSAARTVSLGSFLGHRRIVLLFGPGAPFLERVRAEQAQFEERDLSVLAVVPPSDPVLRMPHAGPTHVLADADGKVGHAYGAGDGTPVFYLIGKDGHVALARHGYPTTHELFGVIDAMPMRRQEMRERGR